MKRKIYILPYLIITFLLACILAAVFVLRPAMADEERFEVSCKADDSIYVPDGIEKYPIKVTIKNNGADFEGTLKIMLYTGSETDRTIAYGQQAVIPAGEEKTFQFNIQGIVFWDQDYQIPIRVDLLDENGNVVYQTASYFLAGADGYNDICTGVVSRDTRISQGLNVTEFEYESSDYEGYIMSGTITLHGIDLTSEQISAMDLSRLQMMVIEENISDDAWDKVAEWLTTGGHLLIYRPLYDQLTQKPLDEQQMTTYGIGKIMVYDREAWNGAMLIQSVKTLFGSELGRCVTGSGDDYWQTQRALSYDVHSPIPEVGRYLIILLIYIVVIGPVGYLLLKKKDKREYLWALIPCMAFFFFVIIYQAGSSTRYAGPFIMYNSQVWLTDEGNVENTRLALVNPDKQKVIISADEDRELAFVNNEYYWYSTDDNINERQKALLGKNYDIALASSGERTDVLVNSRTVFQKEYLKSTRVLDSTGSINCDLTFYKGALSGTITNETAWDLSNCFVMNKGIIVMVGDLLAGASIELNQEKIDYIWNYTGLAIDFDTSAYSETNETAANNVMNDMAQKLVAVSNEQAVIGGFTADYDIDIESSQLTFIDGLAMITKSVQIAESTDDWKTQAIVYGKGSTAEDRESYDNYYYYIYESELELDYQLDRNYDPDYLEWLNGSPDDQTMAIAFYNNETGEYDQVFKDSSVIEGAALSPYLNTKNLLKVKVTISDMNTEHYIPAFTISGGEKND